MSEKASEKRLEKKPQAKQKSDITRTWGLVAGAVIVPAISLIFVGAVAGWFRAVPTTRLDSEYYLPSAVSAEDWSFIETLSPEQYQELIDDRKSFVMFVDQGGCTTADRLRGFIRDYASEAGVGVYRMMFSDLRETNLKGQVKYYPSVVIFAEGKPVAWLDTSSEEDVDEYNEYDAFKAWMSERIARP